MENHKIKSEDPITLDQSQVGPIANSWPFKLQLDHKLKTENMNSPEFIKNYSSKFILIPRIEKKLNERKYFY